MKKKKRPHANFFLGNYKPLKDSVKFASEPRLLYFDLETSPSLGFVWGKYEQNVIEFEKEWYIMSLAYKWEGEKTRVVALPDFYLYKKNPEDDSKIVTLLWMLFDHADYIIAHNAKNFDWKKANTRFVELGLRPPSPYKVLDTKQIAKKYFMFNSNKLDDLGKDLGIGRKVETGGYDLWRKCIQGDKKAWAKMKLYNKGDVELLYKLWKRLLPWTQETLIRKGCPKCGGELEKRGLRKTIGNAYQRYACQSCGGWSSERMGTKIQKPLISL